MTTSAVQIVATAGGNVSYSDAGSGEIRVLLHSLLTDRAAFDPIAGLLGGRVIGVDLPGFGATELRVPVVGNLGAVLFLDGGNVWTNPWDFNLNDLRYDVGPGIRYNTPIGPLRVDVGYQLNPIPGLLVNGEPETRRFRVHFSIGQAF